MRKIAGITSFLLVLSCTSFAQNISLYVKDVTLDSVFKKIKEQTGYNFMYENNLTAKSLPVTIQVTDMPLNKVLDMCVKNQPFKYAIVEKTIVLIPLQPPSTNTKLDNHQNGSSTISSNINVFGYVKDSTGAILEGATVTIESINKKAITDERGSFEFSNIPPNSLLSVEIVGQPKQSFPLAYRRNVILVLSQKANILDEVVVVGYGEKKKEQVTYAVTTLSAKQIKEMPATSLGQVFAGRTPGMLTYSPTGAPGEESLIMTVRTANKNADLAPLLVIDGVPSTQVKLQNINPDEVESISVLKDNASTAVYGARAANGVIIVTTKRGKAGKAQFAYTGDYTWSSPTRMATRINSYEYALAKNEYNVNSGLAPLYPAGILDTIKNQKAPYLYANTDWLADFVSRKAFIQNHSMNVQGGSDNVRYFIIGTYSDQKGMIPTDYYKRYTLQSNLDITFSRQFKAQVNLGYRNGYLHYPGGGSSGTIVNIAAAALPILPAFMPNGSFAGAAASNNPYALMSDQSGYMYTNNSLLTGRMRLTWEPAYIKGLSAYINYYTDKSFTRGKNYIVPVPTYAISPSSPTGYTQVAGTGLPSLTDNTSDATTYTTDLAISYSKQFNKHKVELFALYTQSKSSSNSNSDTRLNLIAPGLDILNLGSTTGETTSGSRSQSGREGYVGRASYSYDRRLVIDLSFREDASTLFAPGHRWGFFPAASAGWIISKERWFQKTSKVVDFLKLRGSVGLTGDDNIGSYTYYYLYGIANNQNSYIFGNNYTATFNMSNATLPNRDITWARNRQVNLGVDATLWKGKLGLTFDIYQKDRYDILLIQNAALPTTFGIGTPIQNAGKTRDKGFEVALTSDNIQLGKNVLLSLNANLTYVTTTYIENGTSSLPDYQRTEGRSVNASALYHAIGIFQSQAEIDNWKINQDGQNNKTLKPGDLKFADLDGDGKITAADRNRWANNFGYPPVNYGFGFDLKYKNVTLTAFFNGAIGNNIVYNTASTILWWKYTYDNSWRPDKPGSLFPRISSSTNNNSAYYPSDWQMLTYNYLRLRNIRLNYDLPAQWLKTIKLKQIRCYLQAANLFTFSKLQSGMDPEYTTPGPSGALPNFYPTQKNIGFGVNIIF